MLVVFDAVVYAAYMAGGCSGGRHPTGISTLFSLIINVKSVLSDD